MEMLNANQTHDHAADTRSKVDLHIKEIKALPQVIYKIISATEDENGSVADLEREIQVDPAFSAKLFATANSSFYSLPKKVNSIREAVMIMGTNAIREAALSASVGQAFIGKSDKESLRRRAWWRSALATASLCRWFVETGKAKDVNSAEAFTVGLLHLIGCSVIDQAGEHLYDQVDAQVEKGTSAREAEKSAAGIDHIEAAQLIAEKWSFPEHVVDALNYLDAPDAGGEVNKLRALVHLAHWMNEYHEGNQENASAALASADWALEVIGTTADKSAELLEKGSKVLSLRTAA